MKPCPTQSVSEEKFRESGQLNKAADNRDSETCVVDNFLSRWSHDEDIDNCHNIKWTFSENPGGPQPFFGLGSDRAIGSCPVH